MEGFSGELSHIVTVTRPPEHDGFLHQVGKIGRKCCKLNLLSAIDLCLKWENAVS